MRQAARQHRDRKLPGGDRLVSDSIIMLPASAPDGPKWTEIAQLLLLALGGAFAAWRWGFEEWIKRKREIPIMDGELSAKALPLDGKRLLVTARTVWHNRGTIPVYANVKGTSLVAFTVPLKSEDGAITYNKDKKIAEVFPFYEYDFCVFEPGTHSEISMHLNLESGHIYYLEFNFPLNKSKTPPPGRDVIIYTRKCIFDARDSRVEAKRPTNPTSKNDKKAHSDK